MPDNSAALAHLRALLNSGATSAVIDGQTVSIDPASIRRRIRELEATDDSIAVPKRPVVSTLDMTGLP